MRLVSLLLLLLHLSHILCNEAERNDFDIIACRIQSRLKGKPIEEEEERDDSDHKRIIVIGDIHGCLHGLLEVMYKAGLILSKDSCEWKPTAAENILLIQVGDIVDRGNNTLGVYNCLEHLQGTVPSSSKLIRLIGNHEIWWLSGSYHNRNKDTDNKNSIREVVEGLKSGIREGKILGSFVTRVLAMPILFTHAGFRPGMIDFVRQEYGLKNNDGHDLQPEHLSEYVNNIVNKMTSEEACTHLKTQGDIGKEWTHCKYDHELFEAGPDRGGNNIGGPYWTDYSVLSALETESESIVTSMVQVVGHTISPKKRIRNTRYMEVIGVDSGMYIGGRTFLEITKHGRFIAHEKSMIGGNEDENWTVRDLTRELCGT